MTPFIIYGLIDPRTLMIRYVGRSSSGFRHPKSYLTPSHLKDNTYRTNWIKELVSSNLKFDIISLEQLDSSENLNTRERWWIAYGRCLGWPLTNLTDGGEGNLGYKLSPETKVKISEANTGRIPTQAARAANAAAQRGRVHSEETRAKIREKAIVRNSNPELREYMRKKSTGYKHTPEALEKMRKPRIKRHPLVTENIKQQRKALANKRPRNDNGTFI